MRVGVDEAGKGPVLGPMIAAAVAVPEAAAVPDGVADSKRLSAQRREELAKAIGEDDRIAVGVATVPVDRIDDPETDMNALTVRGQAEAVDCAVEATADGEGTSVDDPAVLADACDTSEQRFARRLDDACDVTVAIQARHGADDDDPVVAAASIVAKVERDARVDAIAEEYGDVGSGYPSDGTTRAFLESYVREHGELPDCARASWSTCEDVLAEAEQAGLGEF